MVPVRRRNRSLVLMILWGLAILLGLKDMQIHYYPELSRRYLSIRLTLEGAWQEQMETLLIDPLERELRMLGDLNEIRSYSGDEEGRIVLRLKEGADADQTRLRVQEITERIPLPPRAQRPVIETGKREQAPVFAAMLEPDGEISPGELKTAFTALRGCGRVDTGGVGRRDLVLSIPRERLVSLGLSPSDTAAELRDVNSPVLIPLNGGASLSLDPRFSSPGEAETLRVKNSIRIGDLGRVQRISADSESVSRINGEEKPLIWVRESGEGDTISLCRALRKITAAIPGCTVVYDRGRLIENALKQIVRTLLISAGAVALLTALLVRKPLPVLLLSLNLPFSLGGSLALCRLLGWKADILSLAGLALTAGMIIDAGIIYLESGYRRARGPLVSSLISTLLVFLVFVFAPRSLLIPCRSLIRSCAAALILSLIYILTVMHPYLDQREPAGDKGSLMLRPPPARICLLILGAMGLLSLPGAASVGVREGIGLPDPALSFSLEYPAGIPKETLALRLREFEEELQKKCRLVSALYRDEKASFQLHPRENVPGEELKDWLRSSLEGEEAFLHFPEDSENGGYTIRLFARDRELLYAESGKLSARLSRRYPEASIVLHYKKRLPLIRLRFQPGYPPGPAASDICGELSQILSSPVLGKWFPPGGRDRQGIYDIRVRDPGWKNSLEALKGLKINAHPPLKDLLEISGQKDYGRVEHCGGRRSLSLTIFSSGRSGREIQNSLIRLLEEEPLPGGVRISHGQELEKLARFRLRAFCLLLLALVLLFLLLTAIFEGIRLPTLLLIQLFLTEFFTIALLGLLKIQLSAPLFFALILNGGLSVNNGLLVFAPFRTGPFPSLYRAAKSLEACSSSILSAALTTTAGLIPLLFRSTESAELLPALSLTVGMGVLLSPLILVLTLPLFFPKEL